MIRIGFYISFEEAQVILTTTSFLEKMVLEFTFQSRVCESRN